MKIFIFVCLLACALAEPPVGDGYPSARSSHDHDHNSGFQRSLSQEYGVPGVGARSHKDHDSVHSRSQSYFPASRSGLSQEYGAPNVRSGLSQEYGPPGFRSGLSEEYGTPSTRSSPSQEYGTPSTRSSPSQEYGVPNARLSQQYRAPNLRNAPSTEYGTPSARLSQEYGVPQSRSGAPQDYKTIGDFPSDSYGTPLQRSLSTQYGQPDFRSNPSEEYGVPSQRSSQRNVSPTSHQFASGFRNAQNFDSHSTYSVPSARHSKPASVVTRNFQSSFGSRGSAQNFGTSRSLSTQYGAANARSSDSYSPNTKAISQSYLPTSRSASQLYGVPNERSLSEYGAPEAGTDLKTNAYASSFDAARSSPSPKYGVPSARDSMPSDQYGVPDQYDSLSNQGYSYARNALDELLNQEPANYDFGYKVNDIISGSDFGHTESRQDNKAEGSYFVVLPDGTKQVVEYEADERGFKPRISVEPAEVRSGYDDNASDLQRSGDGPY